MFYVKAKIGDLAEINIDITDDNTFTTCPLCGVEHAVNLEEVFNGDGINLFGTVVYCSKCSQALSRRDIP